MRTQYHFRESAKGQLLIWDVKKLVKESQHLKAISIKVDQVKELDQCYWYEFGEEKPTCLNIIEHMKIIQAADLSYPILLCADGQIMDGMHRVCKAKLENRKTIDAIQFDVTPEPDFIDIDPKDLVY